MMTVYGIEISDEIVTEAFDALPNPFSSFQLAAYLHNLGQFDMRVASEAANRILQKRRKAGHIKYRHKGLAWYRVMP